MLGRIKRILVLVLKASGKMSILRLFLDIINHK